jgi:hypothetical protein
MVGPPLLAAYYLSRRLLMTGEEVLRRFGDHPRPTYFG